MALVSAACWCALAAQSMRHDPRRHGGGRHAGAHASVGGAANHGGSGEGAWPGVPPCVGVALKQPSAALAAPGGTWQPQPYFRRTMALREYPGVAGRKPALPTWVVTSGKEEGVLRLRNAAVLLPRLRLRYLDGFVSNNIGEKRRISSDKTR